MNPSQNQSHRSLEAQVLRHLRLSKNLSLNQAGRVLRITGSAIAHMEQGRMDISKKRIETMVQGYGYAMDEFYEYLDGKPIPINYRDECLIIIRQLEPAQLQAIYPILVNFYPQTLSAGSRARK